MSALLLPQHTEIVNGVELEKAVPAGARGSRLWPCPGPCPSGISAQRQARPRSETQVEFGARYRSERLLGAVFAPFRCADADRLDHQADDRSGGPRCQSASR